MIQEAKPENNFFLTFFVFELLIQLYFYLYFGLCKLLRCQFILISKIFFGLRIQIALKDGAEPLLLTTFSSVFKYFFWCAPFGYHYFHYFSIVTASIAYNHPVYGARIQTHNHPVVSPLPEPLDHGSPPTTFILLLFHKLRKCYSCNLNLAVKKGSA